MDKVITNASLSNEITEREIAHRALARKIASESIVLLKNDGVLPLAPCPVALFGAGASATIKGGTGSGEVNERYSVTIRQGLENAGFSLLTQAYLDEYDEQLKTEKNDFNKKFARKLIFGLGNLSGLLSEQFRYPAGRPLTISDAQSIEADVCIYAAARQAGEGCDRKLHDYKLYQSEADDIKLLARQHKKVILIINAGGQMDISALDDSDVSAIVFFCQQGMEGGNALADILTGAVTPSGCLTATWPEKYEDWPGATEYSYLKGHCDFDEYKEGIYVGYRYFDSFGKAVRYPFGYGLSYTDFKLEVSAVTADKADIAVKVKVTNTGKHSGKKTVQAYVSAPSGKLAREYQSLAAFGKTGLLQPSQSQEISLAFALTDIAGYDERDACYILEKGDYVLRIGSNAKDTADAAVITLDETVITEKCANICTPPAAIQEMQPGSHAPASSGNGNAARLTVRGADINAITHSYDLSKPHMDDKAAGIFSRLSADDMLKLLCGTGMFGGGPDAFSLPGAAGNTTSHLKEIGVPNAALCDGPAGVRVQRQSVLYKNGKLKPADAMIEFMGNLPKPMKMLILGDPAKGPSYYQYASAFPVGTAIAQTWDTGLMEEFGDAIGTEMAQFGCTFWLAPGMNIQRNPLCGRNFEYFSEDPLLTGKAAAAVTRGVQKHEGCYVTIKHFAANNQENNRNKSDSRLNERALREIYLKGYRIAIRESGAKSVMTSYNKINGVYAPNSRDLCTKVLRCEWGFDGVVMTDWFSTRKGLADDAAAIEAGNDLLMPGSKKALKALADGLSAGRLSEEALRTSSMRVLQSVLRGRTCIEWEKQIRQSN